MMMFWLFTFSLIEFSIVENFFPHLQTMYWYRGDLTAIDADDLEPFSDLLVLYMQYNNII